VVGNFEVDYGPEENAHGPFKSYGPGGILWVSFLRNLGENLMPFFLIPFHASFDKLTSTHLWNSMIFFIEIYQYTIFFLKKINQFVAFDLFIFYNIFIDNFCSIKINSSCESRI